MPSPEGRTPHNLGLIRLKVENSLAMDNPH